MNSLTERIHALRALTANEVAVCDTDADSVILKFWDAVVNPLRVRVAFNVREHILWMAIVWRDRQ